MIEKTYNFGQFMTMNDQQLDQAFEDMKTMPLDELLDLTLAGADYIAGQTDAITTMLDHTRKAIEADRKNTIKRLRELGEEKARFVADTLENDWFFGRK